MKTTTNTLHYTITVVTALLFACCADRNFQTQVTDIEGHVYPIVTIGNKVWMAANLQVTRYRNGDPIPMVTDSTAWGRQTTGAYCFYNNDSSHNTAHGKLYNWYALNDSRNIAPEGWHIPTNEEINALIAELEKTPAHADKFKTFGLSGYRFHTGGSFHTLGYNGYWWSANSSFEIYDWSPRLFTALADVERNKYEATYGMAIRCVKD